jgi:hypothetical protein
MAICAIAAVMQAEWCSGNRDILVVITAFALDKRPGGNADFIFRLDIDFSTDF